MADDILTLMNVMHDHPFIQEIIQTKGKPPSVILYLKEQIQDIKLFCSSDKKRPSVLGVDRTFNLGPCFVTVLVYQQNNLFRKGTSNHPIMLGPVFLHWDGLYTTYNRFFSHIQGQLEKDINGIQVSGHQLVLGSDEEKALLKAMKEAFPTADNILCSRHIKDNLKRQLRNKIGANDTQIKEIEDDIFGSAGLLAMDDEFEYEMRVLQVNDKYLVNMPELLPYFQKLTRLALKYLFLPAKKNKSVPITWKNNSCESMNHILKLACNWRSQKQPELVDIIFKIVRLQYADIKRAIYGMGNYELTPWMEKLKVSQVHWSAKSEEDKEQHFQKFLKGATKKKRTTTDSSGKLSVPTVPRTAKKPGQRKRVKSERTTKHF